MEGRESDKKRKRVEGERKKNRVEERGRERKRKREKWGQEWERKTINDINLVITNNRLLSWCRRMSSPSPDQENCELIYVIKTIYLLFKTERFYFSWKLHYCYSLTTKLIKSRLQDKVSIKIAV